MIYDLPLLRSLDPHHSRLGYLGALAAVSVRSLDTYDALVARLSDLLYERFYEDEPRFEMAMSNVDEPFVPELRARMARDEEENPAAILAPPNSKSGWLTRSEFWLYDRRMPSHVGYLVEKHVGRTVDFGRWTGILLPTLDLSETGFLLQYLVTGGHPPSAAADRNFLLVRSRPALRLLYLQLLFSSEILFPSLICEFIDRLSSGRTVATRGQHGLLRGAVARLIESLGEPTDPEDVLAFREVSEFSRSVLKSQSTEENYLRPRLETLVDIGIINRKNTSSSERGVAFPWELPNSVLHLGNALSPLASNPRSLDIFLDSEFIGALSPALEIPVTAARRPEEPLFWFAKAYSLISRDIGFTPGRTVAMLASFLAAEAGTRLEMKDLFAAVYSVPQGDFANYFQFSGGSRFDREFMIKVGSDLLPVLEKRLNSSPVAN